MHYAEYISFFAILCFALCNAAIASHDSLDGFLRDLPSPAFNISQILPISKDDDSIISRPRKAWNGDTPEPASDALWCKAVAKGTTLLNAMSYSESDAGRTFTPPLKSAQSFWSLDMLQPWGWDVHTETDAEWCNWESNGYWGFANYLRSLGVSAKCVSDGGLWTISMVVHGKNPYEFGALDDQTYFGPDGQERRVTGADMYMGVNGAEGGAVTLKRHGCADRALLLEPPVPADQFPALKASSDLLWALWEKDVLPVSRPNINFFMSLSIENADALAILRRALDQVNSQLTRMPGRKFDMSSEEGKAILGSPNAVAFAYFLITHKPQLGNKIIDAVRVMECETSHRSPCMYFSVTSYATPRVPPGASSAHSDPAVRASKGARVVRKDARNFLRLHKISL